MDVECVRERNGEHVIYAGAKWWNWQGLED